MTFEQLRDLYFSQEGAGYDEQALRYFWNAAVVEERERHGPTCICECFQRGKHHGASMVGGVL